MRRHINNSLFNRAILISLLPLSVALTSCQNETIHTDTVQTAAADKITDAPIFRSVLDQRPRMVTLRLANDFWAAYDTAASSIYKVWKKGVNFEGAVYNQHHGPQPTSKGGAWFVSSHTDPWSFVTADGVAAPVIRYRGHSFSDSENPRPATLNWTFQLQDNRLITVTETPKFVIGESGQPGLERVFSVSNAPEDLQLQLRVHLNSLPDSKSVSTDGHFAITHSQAISRDNQQVTSLEGVLTLNSNKTTRFTTWFHNEPMVPAAINSDKGPEKTEGQIMVEHSDCQACHNEELKTVGPAYRAIAEKYPHTDSVIARLTNKIIAGGSGVWGSAMMTAHPSLSREDAGQMLAYILSLDGETRSKDKLGELGESIALSAAHNSTSGLAANLYLIDEAIQGFRDSFEELAPVFSGVMPAVHALTPVDFASYSEEFYLDLHGFLNIETAGDYLLRLVSDDGSLLTIDGEIVIDHGGFHGAKAKEVKLNLAAGKHSLSLQYFQGGGGSALSLQWMKPMDQHFSVVPTEMLSHQSSMIKQVVAATERNTFSKSNSKVAGTGMPVSGVHPSFDLQTIRPESFQPMVGGLDLLSDGRVVVSTWDNIGGVYVLSNVDSDDPEDIHVQRIAAGLAEPLGIKVVEDQIYVLQKHELTRLVDNNGDGITDFYETVSNDWRVSANFHEFAFGLEYRDGYFYAALATAINPGGASTQPQIPDRGKVIKISRDSGTVEFIAHGLRTPNGVGTGVDGEMFIADNQGDWLPASKIVHVKPGAFYGSRSVDFSGTSKLPVTQPVVWLPQDEIGNSPSQPTWLDIGPYRGQMIHGEVTHGGIKRVFVEKVNGNYQGAVFRFTQGIEAGVNRLAWGADNKLYVGGIGNPGNWGHSGASGKKWYGLQRLSYNGKSTFEMLKVSARSNGMEIEFTEALQENDGLDPANYQINQWWYEPTEDYGGPKRDQTTLKILSVNMSADRKRVFLELDGMKPGHVLHVQLRDRFVSALNHQLWTTESWYTLNSIPKNYPGFTHSDSPMQIGFKL